MNDPFARLPVVPSFTVTSTDVTDGQALPPAQMSGIFQVPGGKDLSPQLSWSGAPAETKSYTVTMYDPDAPSGSGFWHWAVADIPASVTGSPQRSGGRHRRARAGRAFHIPNDVRLARFIGAGTAAWRRASPLRHRGAGPRHREGQTASGAGRLDSSLARLQHQHQRASPRPRSHHTLGRHSQANLPPFFLSRTSIRQPASCTEPMPEAVKAAGASRSF